MSSIINPVTETILRVNDYDLAATLDSGQAFRWQRESPGRGQLARGWQDHAGEPPAPLCPWVGVIGKHWVRLTQASDGIHAATVGPVADWQWLRDYLQTDLDLAAVLKTFPDDAPLRDAVAACRGLRVLRQGPWECLASFILSSTKQIVQIRQIVALLCERFGEPVSPASPKGGEGCLPSAASERRTEGEKADCFETKIPSPRPSPRLGGAREENALGFAFPTPQRLAALTEADLRACKMGFRAPHLLAAARQIAEGRLDLERLRRLPLPEAREALIRLRGVGGKIADCVLLFAYGFDGAFPVDVWVERALRELYFPRRRVGDKRLRHFAATHFGPHAGHAQQYLFHYMRTKMK
jgi:N-glycosylase/DNA lyase